MRKNLEDKLKTERETKFKHLRTFDKKSKKYVKTDAEMNQAEEDRKKVIEEVKQQTFETAKKHFYGPTETVRNPWSDNIGGTMFWM